MPKLAGDFSKISSSFEILPEGDYRVQIEDIKEGESKNKIPQVVITLKVLEGDKEGAIHTEFLTLKTNEGKPNNISLGRIKAYAEAILGDEAANSADGIDTDDLKGGTCLVYIKHRSYEQNGESKTSADVKKVMRA